MSMQRSGLVIVAVVDLYMSSKESGGVVINAVEEKMQDMTSVDKGKLKVVVVLSDEEEEGNKKQIYADTGDAEEENGAIVPSRKGAGGGSSRNHVENKDGNGNSRRARCARGNSRPTTVKVEAQISAAVANFLAVAPLVQADKRAVDSLQSSRKKAKFREIARRRAAHYAFFPSEEDKPAVVTVSAGASGLSVAEQTSRSAELLAELAARVAAGGGHPDNGVKGNRSSPFIIARQIVEGHAAAAIARQSSARVTAEEKSKPLGEWSPSRQPYFRKDRVAASLQEKCIEVLCANVEHVVSLVGVPEFTKKRMYARLCAQRAITPTAVRLYFESEPAHIVVPDCTLITEENLAEAVTRCPTQQLQVLELGMCGRSLLDQLCATSWPVLHTLTLTGAYRLTDSGLKALLSAAPNLISLNLDHCNKISAIGLHAVADSVGTTLTALSLDSCIQLEALTLLPSLLKMSSLQNLNLSGISGMSDAVMNELAVILGSTLRELSIAGCRGLTDAAISIISLCCTHLRLLDLSHTPMLTDLAIGRLADGCRSLRRLRLNRGKFSDTALAALVTASGNSLCELSLNSVRQAGEYTISALAMHSKGTLEQLDLSFCRAVSDQSLGLLADSCANLREIRLFGCTQVTRSFLEGHSNPALNVIGLQSFSSK